MTPFTKSERISVPNMGDRAAKEVFRDVALIARTKMEEVYRRRFQQDLNLSELAVRVDSREGAVTLFYRKEDVETGDPFFGQSRTTPSVEKNEIANREESHVGVEVFWYG